MRFLPFLFLVIRRPSGCNSTIDHVAASLSFWPAFHTGPCLTAQFVSFTPPHTLVFVQKQGGCRTLTNFDLAVAAGGLLPQTAHSTDADAFTKISGSFFIVQADTAEQAWETLKKDPFWHSGEVVRQFSAFFRAARRD